MENHTVFSAFEDLDDFFSNQEIFNTDYQITTKFRKNSITILTRCKLMN